MRTTEGTRIADELEGDLEGIDDLEHVRSSPYGDVFRAKARGASVVLRIRESPERSDASNRQFRRESALLASLNSPAVPAVFETDDSSGFHYTVTEYIEGESLEDRLADGPIDESRVSAWALDVSEALRLAHDRSLVHRNIRPRNLIFQPEDRTRLTGFALAELASDRDGGDPPASFARYAAPEQLGALDRPPDHRTDLYGLGLVLYRALAGSHPFDDSSTRELIRQHRDLQPDSLSETASTVSDEMSDLVDELLRKRPDDRPESARVVSQRLRNLAGEADREDGDETTRELVGRDDILGDLLGTWRRVRDGKGAVVGLRGPAGSGKTHLARQFTARASSDDTPLLWTSCLRGTSTPLGALQRAAAPLVDGDADTDVQIPALGQVAMVWGGAGSGSGDDPNPEQFYEEIAEYFIRIADKFDGAILTIDDLHWCDSASRRALRQLADRVDEAPLLVLATYRSEESGTIEGPFEPPEEGETEARIFDLEVLDRSELETFIADYLGSEDYPVELVDRIEVVSGGVPFLAVDFLFTLVDAGYLEPDWGAWRYHGGEVRDLDVPEESLSFIVQRLEHVDEHTRDLLRPAAVLGGPFDPQFVAELMGVEPPVVRRGIQAALGCRVLVRDEGGYSFVHDRVRQTLLDSIDGEDRRTLHQRAAEALASDVGDDTARLHRAATHFLRGAPDRTPELAFDVLRDAGMAANENYSFAEAFGSLEEAERIADEHDLSLDVRFLEARGRACAQTGRLEDARRHYQRAASETDDPVEEARYRAYIGEAYIWDDLRSAETLEQVDRGLRRLGRQNWDYTAVLAWSALWSVALGLLVRLTGIGAGSATGDQRKHCRVLMYHFRLAQHAEYWGGHPIRSALQVFRGFYAANRLGRSPEQLEHFAAASAISAAVTWDDVSEWYTDQTLEIADELDDPRHETFADVRKAWARHLRGMPVESLQSLTDVLENEGHWLQTGDFAMACGDVVWNLKTRGRALEGVRWAERGLERAGRTESHNPPSFLYTTIAGSLAQLGRFDEARSHLENLQNGGPEHRLSSFLRALKLGAECVVAQQAENWNRFDEIVETFRDLDFDPGIAPLYACDMYVYVAHGELARSRNGLDLGGSPAAVDRAHRDLREAASDDHPTLRAHERLVAASRAKRDGDEREASKRLAEAERLSVEYDNRWVLFDVWVRRAHRLRDRDLEDLAREHIRAALRMAREQHWQPRVRRVHEELPDLADPASPFVEESAPTRTTLPG